MMRLLVFIVVVGLSAAEPQLAGFSASQYRKQDELGNFAFGHVGGPNSREEVRAADGTTRGSYSYVDANGIVQSAAYSADAYNGFRVAATNLPVGPPVPAGPTVAHVAAPAVARVAAATIAHVAAPTIAHVAARAIARVPTATIAHVAAPTLAHVPAPAIARVPTATLAHLSVPTLAHVAAPAVAARLALPSSVVGAPLIHTLKKRDIVAVSQPLTSYPGSTAPLVHAVHAPVLAAPVARFAAPLAVAAPLSHIAPYAHILKKRSIYAPLALSAPYAAIHATTVSVPADEPIVAHAKAAQLIQQNTEALRNAFGGIPLTLPADTPEVAAAKIAHSIAHANQAAVNSYRYLLY